MTRFSHHPPQPIASTTTPPRQRGYVLVTFALLLVPLLLLAGLSIDVGSWYNRASDMRKAADAAALAGVVWLPNEAAARSAAIETAARNGFVEGNGVSISVVPVPGTEKRLKVVIRDDRVGSFLWGNLGGNNITLQRAAVAEYQLPVPMGSPRNFFGTGPLVPSPNTELLFQSVNPYCTSKVQGDRHQSGYYSGSAEHCAGTSNSEHWPGGYELFIDAPEGRPASIDVLLYDPRYNNASVDPTAADERGGAWTRGRYNSLAECPAPASGGATTITYYGASNQGYCGYASARRFNGPISYYNGSNWIDIQSGLTGNTQYVLPYTRTFNGPDSYLANSNEEDYTYTLFAENSPFTAADDQQVCSRTFTRTTPFERTFLGSQRWNVLCTIATSWPDGRYILKVANEGPAGTGPRGNGSNQWGVVARYTNGAGNLGNGLCDGRSYGLCPRVYGKEAISVYANTTAGTAQFFLAEIEAIHAGKRLVLELWDPGEGGSRLRILQPSGAGWARKSMTWRSYVNESSTVDRSGSGDTIDVTGDIFNGRRLVIEIDLTDYDPLSTNQWWKIEYEFNNPARPNVTDRTTWTARIEGDPVHLVEEF